MTEHISKLVFYVNGKKVELENPDPELTLLQVLRRKLKLTGTKLGCAEGGCGACTVMVSRYDRAAKTIVHHSVNACLAPVCSMHGLAVTTVEGVGSIENGLHPVQEALAKSHGSQCGFCTPGIVMSMYALLRNNSKPALQDIEAAFEGNLCRCTGYRPILDGFRTFTKEFQCPMGDQCCKVNNNNDIFMNGHAQNGNGVEEVTSEWSTGDFTVYDPTQEAIFPSELQLSDALDTQSLVFSSSRVTWYRPTTLKEVLALKHIYPDAKLVVGNTEVGVEVKLKNMHYPVRVAVGAVQELLQVQHTQNGITVGASTSLTQLQHLLKLAIEEYPEYKTRVFSGMVEMLRWFAGHQIRNVASVAGNIMTASPISDLNPLFLAAGCQLTLVSQESGERTVAMDEDFFRGYRKTAVHPEEVVQSLFIPFTTKNEFFGSYKQAHRRDDDIAIVNAGLRVKLQDRSSVIEDISLAFGGMAPVTVMAVKTTEQLRGKTWDDSLVPVASQLLAEELPLPPGVPGGMESYRRTLTISFFFKFFLTVRIQLQEAHCQDTPGAPLISSDLSATEQYHRKPSKATQIYEEVPDSQSKLDPVGRPIGHVSAQKQVTGQAVYVDDIPLFEDELHMALVLSSKPHALILAVDTTDALMMPGVLDYLDHTDVPGSNVTGLFNDEEVFASKKVVAQGQPIGAILANSQEEAQRAARAVKVTYQDLESIVTIEQAIANNSYLSAPKSIQTGDVEGGFADSDHVVEGEVKCGAQEHFYLETVACIGVPKEDNELEMFCSTQNPSQIQGQAATAMGVPANRVNVRVKRLGGGFGGKETRSALVSTPVALAAMKHKRPVRCVLDRDEDIVMTGTRHAFLGRYKIGFNSDGKIQAANIELYSNCGHSKDLSLAVLDRAMFHIDNSYNLPNVCATGYACKTNIPSATAFRGFGGPQGMFICETYMTAIAEKLGVRPEEIREKNLYVDGDRTHFDQLLENCNITRCWEQVFSGSQWQSRLHNVQQFNRENRWKKRGMAIVPVKFGISFTATFMNQGGALVNIYTDGSVLVTHGGTEMGQGLHTKMMQVASRVLNVDISKIYISETSTASVPNSSPTAASMSSDLYGAAVMNACQALADRLKPYRAARPKDSWKDWVMAAYADRVQLSATGFYKVPDIRIDLASNKGPVFAYFTTGAGCSEVEIDCLTGDHTVLRSDIVMDLGKSLNPIIDIGQIEGAFVQGYGWLTLEEHRYSPTGFIYTRGPGMYKIPGFTDIPVELNVSLLKGSSNPRAVYSSKAVGEPPFFIGASVFFAIRDAIAAARMEVGLRDSFRLDGPATAERIRMACQDQFTQQFPEPEPGTYTPWTVSL